MNERPPQPPEGKLIADAATRVGLSIREASRRAGISYGRWRQITSGVQNISPGVTAPVRAPAATVARMARVVGVTPDKLESEGQRPDAAKILRSEPAPRLVPVPASPRVRLISAEDPDSVIAEQIEGDEMLEFFWRRLKPDGSGLRDRSERIGAMNRWLAGAPDEADEQRRNGTA